MAKIDGIGGVFIYSNNPKILADWYINVLGLSLQELEDGSYYEELYYYSIKNKEKLDSKHNQAMINYRVDNLEEYVHYLNNKNVPVDPIHEGTDAEGIGKFTHLFDPEGNKIELWQPSTGV